MSFKSTALTIAFMVLAVLFILGAGPRPPAHPAAPPPLPEDADQVFFFSTGGARLGVQIADITLERARGLGLKEEIGAEIKGVLPDSPAAGAGLKEGDVIIEYQGTRVQGVAQLTRMVRETPAGRTVTMQVVRDKASREVGVKLGEREDEQVMPGRHFRMPRFRMHDFDFEAPDLDLPEMVGPPFGPVVLRLGAQVEDLNEQLGGFFGVKNGEGVLVRSVHKGGPGDAAGLKAGDVIVRIDAEKIADHADLRTALRDRKDKPLVLAIVRERHETTLKVAAPVMGRPSSGDGGGTEGDEDDADHDTEQIEKEMKRIKTEIRNTIENSLHDLGSNSETL